MSIYLDHAATSFPKPAAVCRAMNRMVTRIGANPGRSEHKLARKANQIISETREKIALLFNISEARRVIFTCNATEAINLGLKGALLPGDHAITSSVEHNSVIRPLKALERVGVQFSQIPCSRQGHLNLRLLKKSIRRKTKLIVLTHASNVIGSLLPIEEVGAFAHSQGILFMVDAAQTAGLLPIDVQRMHIDLLASPGHKSLYGPQGTGFLYISQEVELKPLKEGGTGTDSESDEQPEALPQRFESGTLNTPGIAGLGAGVSFVLDQGVEKIWKKEKLLEQRLLKGLKKIKGIRLYGPLEAEKRVPVISFNLDFMEPAEVGFILDDLYDILVRTGLHCAPQAHRTMGTFPNGTVRVSLGFFNTPEDVDVLLRALREITRTRR
ncbi:MAG: aminotransferase class V-fold PLP-dependent enzyme [Thermodesulfobacteriota bacterium]|nr:aminotransferase class V-fold PLP-dependent enzyme [Thermodesulfobacteriota bacterium]